MASAPDSSKAIAEAIDVIEEAYEFMLAYAAQGRRTEDEGSGATIRDYLKRSVAALDVLGASTPESAGIVGRQAIEDATEFLSVLSADAAKAKAALRFVLSQKSIGSQMIDNLNASIHVRALLTDVFLLDESLKISGI